MEESHGNRWANNTDPQILGIPGQVIFANYRTSSSALLLGAKQKISQWTRAAVRRSAAQSPQAEKNSDFERKRLNVGRTVLIRVRRTNCSSSTYSQRSAVIGSTSQACRAGIAQAIADTKLSRRVSANRMIGSRELPAAHFARIVLVARVSVSPARIPEATLPRVDTKTIRSTCPL